MENTRLLLSVFRKRALSTFTALSRSLTRRLLWLANDEPNVAAGCTQPSFAFDSDQEESQESPLVALPIGLDRRHERTWLQRLRHLADDAARSESKIARLKLLLERTAEPVIIFSEFRDSLEAIEVRLRRSRAIAVMHGAQGEHEQRAELSRYLGGPASVLLATDVAGQGLNLQARGRWVISLELPWNPARLEQRLGRVDRLGQARSPHLSLLVARHEAERGLLSHLARRVLGAQQAFSKDALSDVLPPESHIRTTLLSIEPDRALDKAIAQPPAPAKLELTRGWRRPARVVAGELSRRRSLSRRWRAGTTGTTRMIYARLNRKPRCPSTPAFIPDGQSLAIIIGAVPILNAQDEVIERRVIALTGVARTWVELTSDSTPLIEACLRRRVIKLTRVVKDAAARLAEREAAILVTVLDGHLHRESQPGLFDASELRRFLASTADAERLQALEDREVQRLHASATIRLGSFEPEFVLEWSRGPASPAARNAR
jgi:hypothetical protein